MSSGQGNEKKLPQVKLVQFLLFSSAHDPNLRYFRFRGFLVLSQINMRLQLSWR